MKRSTLRKVLALVLLLLIGSLPASPHTHAADRCPNCGSDNVTAFDNFIPCVGGSIDYTCGDCSNSWSEDLEGHDFSRSEITTQPTCTESGVRTYYCSLCGSSTSTLTGRPKTETVRPLGHNWSTEEKPATCTEAGYTRRTCTRCGESSSTAIAALGHDYVDTVIEATCTEPGELISTCTRCRDSRSTMLPALGHEYEETITEPTCTGPGEKTFTCTRCEDTYKEVIPPAGHVFGDPAVTPATCTEAGVSVGVCTVCGEEVREELPALGHDFPKQWTVEKEAGVFHAGLEYRLCGRCGEREEREIPALGLKGVTPPVLIGAIAALLGALGAGIWFAIRAKRKLRPLKLGSLPERSVFSLLEKNEYDESLIRYLKSKRYVDLEFTDEEEPEKQAEAVADAEPELILLDLATAGELDALKERMDGIREAYEDAVFAVVAARGAGAESELDALKEEEEILDWIPAGTSLEDALTRLILPLVKNELNADNTAEAIGKVADLLGIPVVSAVTTAFVEGRSIRDTIQAGELSASSVASVIGSIAAILGMDGVASVAGLVDDVDTVKEALDREAGVNEGADALEAGKDVVDVITDLLP